MRKLLALLLLAVLLSACTRIPMRHRSIDDSAVLIEMHGGRAFGSGVLLKDGQVLTAGHVVEVGKRIGMKAQTIDGKSHDVDVLWSSEDLDAALLALKDFDPALPTREIACRDPRVGERITVSGFPGIGPIRFKGPTTTTGTVASKVQTVEGDKREIVVLDLTAVQGVSGSAMLSRDGYVIGIVVVVFGATVEDEFGFPFVAVTGYAAGVPAPTVCRLLAGGGK